MKAKLHVDFSKLCFTKCYFDYGYSDWVVECDGGYLLTCWGHLGKGRLEHRRGTHMPFLNLKRYTLHGEVVRPDGNNAKEILFNDNIRNRIILTKAGICFKTIRLPGNPR